MTLEDLYRLLRAGHVQAQGIVDTITQPLLVLDEALCVVTANPAFLRTFSVGRDETIGESLSKLGNGQWNIPGLVHLLREVIPRSSTVVGYEVTHDFPAIGQRTMLVTARRLSHPDNNSVYMLVVFEDVTAARAGEAARDLFVAEIEHRLKNFLALVTALARQIPAEGEEAAKYRDAFLGRLEVLTGAETGLFSDAGNDLAYLVRAVLAPYGGKIRLEPGPALRLGRQQVRALSMILHELATNASKYGALSAAGGSVAIGWTLSEDSQRLSLLWRERGGPCPPATRKEGFGTRLVKSLVRMELGGKIATSFDPEGLTVRIDMPSPEAPPPEE